jgi:hypothetical protein
MAAGVPGLAAYAASLGWRPLGGQPFGEPMSERLRPVIGSLYAPAVPPPAAPSGAPFTGQGAALGPVAFRDAYGGPIDCWGVAVATGQATVAGQARTGLPQQVALCAVTLPAILPLACVQPRRYPAMFAGQPAQTGDREFDELFLVQAPAGEAGSVLRPHVRQLLIDGGEAVVLTERHLLALVRKGGFISAEAAREQVNALLDILMAIPDWVLSPRASHPA